jgi:hypothetical protein
MSARTPKKQFGPIDMIRGKTGLYRLGFDEESVIGLLLPFLVVAMVGGVLGVLIWQVL